MILDKDLELSDKQVVTGSAPSTNTIDTVVAGEAIVAPILNVLCVEDVVGGKVTVVLQSSDTEDFATPEVAIASKTFEVADLKAGKILLKTRLPFGLKRFIRVFYDIDGTLTAGKFSAFICLD